MNDDDLSITLHPRIRKSAYDAEKLASGFKKATTKIVKPKFNKSKSLGSSMLIEFVPHMQNSTVIVKYTNNKQDGSWRAHGNYLARENAQHEKSKGLGFNEDSDQVDIATILGNWQDQNDPRLWKIIISPEFGEKLDLKEHTKVLTAQIEKDLGTKIEWVAIDHYNTDNPHVHLVIRGIDKLGNNLDIDPNYLKSGIRQRSREIATNQLGYRTAKYESIGREKQIDSDRFTSLDGQIISQSTELASGGYLLKLDRLNKDQDYKIDIIKRLKKLSSLGLVTKTSKLTWQIDPEIKTKLKDIGRQAAGIKILERHIRKMSDPNLELVYSNFSKPGDTISGKILGLGLDPDTEKPYLLIEGIDGKAHYVSHAASISSKRLNSDLVDGNLASLTVKSFKKEEGKEIKEIQYLDVKYYGKMIKNQIPAKLIDDYIIDSIFKSQHPIKSLNKTTSFTNQFYNQVNNRLLEFKQHNIINQKASIFKLQHNWHKLYQKLIGQSRSID
jgi:hypothetical protein